MSVLRKIYLKRNSNGRIAMKKLYKISSVFVLFLVLGSLIAVQTGNAQERGFFDNTLDYDTQYFKLKDHTCSTISEECYFVIAVKINTNTEHLSVLDAKDLFIQIRVQQQDIDSEIILINVADVYVEQVIDGGRYGGVPFDQSSSFIGDHDLPSIEKGIPYNYHVGLDGCDTEACIAYREGAFTGRGGDWFTNLQINIEIQLYIDIPKIDEFGNPYVFRYQDYIYAPINDQLRPIDYQAQQSVISLPLMPILLGLFFLGAILTLTRKKVKKNP
jgi:hypothetical protein